MFLSKLIVEDHGEKEFRLLSMLVWETAKEEIIVPTGFISDFASIPAIFRPFFNTTGRSKKPAVLHDWLYCENLKSRSDADRLFYDALRSEGVGVVQAKAMWLGVRMGGWRYYGKRKEGLQTDDFERSDY